MKSKIIKWVSYILIAFILSGLSALNELGYFDDPPPQKQPQKQIIESFTITPEGNITDFRQETIESQQNPALTRWKVRKAYKSITALFTRDKKALFWQAVKNAVMIATAWIILGNKKGYQVQNLIAFRESDSW